MNHFMLEQYIDTSLCEEIIEEFNMHVSRWSDSTRNYWLVSSDNMRRDLVERYETEVCKVISQYRDTFFEAFEGFESMTLEKPYNFQKYTPGNHYSTWHCENNGKKQFEKRVFAFMTYLNTVEDGGETEFLYQKWKVTPKKGKTLVWPAYFTHTHRGLPAKNELKYIITGWVAFSPWVDVSTEQSDEEFFKTLELATRVTW